METRRLRPLLIAEGANPLLTSASLVGWSCVKAIAEITDSHIVTEWRNRDAFLQAGLREGVDFTAIDTRRSQGLAWRITKTFSRKNNFSWSLYAILSNMAYPCFERAVWKHFATRLTNGEFDLVHRILPLSPTTPSWIAGPLKRIGVPFVLGPLNGGVPWPKGFEDIRGQEKDGAGRLRKLYRLLPGIHQTRKQATAILVGSGTTLREMSPEIRRKCVFLPENAIDTERFSLTEKPPRTPGPLRVAFVGRLVALKGIDMLIEAASPLMRAGEMMLDIIGDGPERNRLQALLERHGIRSAASMDGWVDHAALQPRLQQSDVLALPSIREFGGGVVLEAMALGLPPIVLDHGGPPELVPDGGGYVLPLKCRQQVVHDLRQLFINLCQNPNGLASMGKTAQAHVQQYFTWPIKARQIHQVYEWMLGLRTEKPNWGVPFGKSVIAVMSESRL